MNRTKRRLETGLECIAVDEILRAIRDLGLDADQTERALRHESELRNAMRDAVIKTLGKTSVSRLYKEEEVETSFGYYSGYQEPVPIGRQLEHLRILLPGLRLQNRVHPAELPFHAEGWFAIPRWEAVAASYNEAVAIALSMLSTQRLGKFSNLRSQDDSWNLSPSMRTKDALASLCKNQDKSDVIILPAQLGLKRRGLSVRRALRVMQAKEFGLDMFTVCMILLTHHHRLQNADDLDMVVSGNKEQYLPQLTIDHLRELAVSSVRPYHVTERSSIPTGFLL